MKTLLKIIAGFVLLLVIVIGFIASKYTASSLSREDLEQYADQTLVLPTGMTVNYRIAGNPDGQTVLLIHGGSDSLGTWSLWEQTLAEHYRLVSVDLPGHGLTDPDPERAYGRWMFARFIKAFVDAMGLDQFVIIGHSYGGETAMRYVLDNPGKATGMVLVAAGGYAPKESDKGGETEALIADLARSPLGPLLDHLSYDLLLGEGESDYITNTAFITEEYLLRQSSLGRYEKNRDTLRHFAIYADETYRDLDGIEQIDLPTLILAGEKDKIVPLWMMDKMHEVIVGSELIVYPNIGHMVQQEEPYNSAEAVIEFMRRKGLE